MHGNASAPAEPGSVLHALGDPDVAVDLALAALLPEEAQLPSSPLGFVCRAGLLWAYYYVFIHLLYYGIGASGRALIGAVKPAAPTLRVQGEDARAQMHMSELAFPLYCCVPVLGDVLRRYNLSRTCPTVEACGGPAVSTANFLVYMWLVEAMVFWVHYFLLHKWPWGKANLKHDLHHAYKHDFEMTTWSGYAFEAVDGASQGLPFILGQCLVPIPHSFGVAIGALTGVWTMYIHVGTEFPMPWPLMGCDYHHIHHVYNWYNFGLFTQFWDWAFGTLKHPSEKTREFVLKTASAGGEESLEGLHKTALREMNAAGRIAAVRRRRGAEPAWRRAMRGAD